MTITLKTLEDKLWKAADDLRADSELDPSEYSVPVLGLIFLKYADSKFSALAERIGNSDPEKLDVLAEGVMYLPVEARYRTLLNLPEGTDISKAINNAMKLIENENEDLKGVLPKNYSAIPDHILIDLLKNFSSIQFSDGDVFGRIYEYFLGRFASAEGKNGGKYFTPTSVVRLIVEVIEPFHGRIFDPACGSGGMFVQSANFVEAHHKSANTNLSVYGQEMTARTVLLGKMNLAVHGINGDIRKGNSYYEDIHDSVGKFDFVMANPEFNVDGIDKDRIKSDPRFTFGLPATDNGNYIWIQMFYSALNEKGRAGFVMPNSASDARSTELEIRKKIIQDKVVDVIISVSPNMFYTVTLPCHLWFFDKAKRHSDRSDKVLFIDARNIYSQIDRSHREFAPDQIEFISNIVNLYRGEDVDFVRGSNKLFAEHGMSMETYSDVLGLCKVATLDEIEDENWTLNPGRYVSVKANESVERESLLHQYAELNDQLRTLNLEAHELEGSIAENASEIVNRT